MGRHSAVLAIGVLVMVALIVGLDVTLLRERFALRLAVNVGIVLVFGVAYLVLRDRS
ncbi:MAG TPA: hypothetical protein VN088_10080 [Nocardioides sp.]|nr:hypothetical protein [Nocardioides sp.]